MESAADQALRRSIYSLERKREKYRRVSQSISANQLNYKRGEQQPLTDKVILKLQIQQLSYLERPIEFRYLVSLKLRNGAIKNERLSNC